MPRKMTTAQKSVANRRGLPKRAAERIRESARELFYREGIRAVGVDEIVTRAGVTKPSLYRSFSSKDELAATYLRDNGEAGLRRFNAAMDEQPNDPRGQFRAWLVALSADTAKPGYRGCGTTNAAVEYPDRRHPARKQAAAIKKQFRERLNGLALAMGAEDPGKLADALLLLLEGTYVTGQLFGRGGPPRIVVEAADVLIDAMCRR